MIFKNKTAKVDSVTISKKFCWFPTQVDDFVVWFGYVWEYKYCYAVYNGEPQYRYEYSLDKPDKYAKDFENIKGLICNLRKRLNEQEDIISAINAKIKECDKIEGSVE